MLFQHHITQALHGHAARAIAVAVHHAHARIVAGNEVLHNHGVIVARRVHARQNLLKLACIIADERLLFARIFAIPVCHAIRRLHDNRIRERRLVVAPVLRRYFAGFRELQPKTQTRVVETLFRGQKIELIRAHNAEQEIIAQRVLIAHEHFRVVVAARRKHHGLPGVCVGKGAQRAHEHLVVFQVRLGHVNGHQLAVLANVKRALANSVRGLAIFFEKRTRHAVSVGVSSQQNGGELQIGTHFYSFPLFR